jgi:hypothetical protein
MKKHLLLATLIGLFTFFTVSGQKKIAYIVASPLPAALATDDVYNSLVANSSFSVTAVACASNSYKTAAVTGADLIILTDSPGSTAAGISEYKGINKPFLCFKPTVYKTSGILAWSWTTSSSAYGDATGCTTIQVASGLETHPIFNGVAMTGGLVTMYNTLSSNKGINYMTLSGFTTVTGGTITPLAAPSTVTTASNIFEIPAGTKVAGTLVPQKFLQVGLFYTAISTHGYLTTDALKLITNACNYLLAVATPTTQSSNLTATTIAPNYIDLTWTKGDGNSRIVFATTGSTNAPTLTDGTTYSVDNLIGEWKCIYNDMGNAFTYSGLTISTPYKFVVYDYNGAPGAEKYIQTTATNNLKSFSTIASVNPPEAPAVTAATAITTQGFNANWSAAATATAYMLDVSTSATFATLVTGFSNINVGNVLTYPITGLTTGTTYYYRVRASNIGGASASSNTITVVTIPAVPTATAVTSLAATSFTANWNIADASTTGYYLDVASDLAFTKLVVNNVNVSNVTSYVVTTSILAGTTYYYRVRAYNPGGTSVSSNTITLLTTPAPTVSTAATSVGLTNFTVNWKPTFSATGYQIDIATDAAFSLILPNYTSKDLPTTPTTLAVTGLTTDVTYYYRLRAYNASGTGNSGNTTTVNLYSAPAVPTALPATTIAPANLFAANWLASPTAYGYKLDVATDSGFTQLAPGYSGKDVPTGTSYLITNLPGHATYYYRVRAYNTGGISNNSNVISLTNVGTPVKEITGQPVTIVVVQGSIVIEASATITAAYLTDLNGKIIANIKNSSTSLTIPTGNNKGIHLLKVVTTNEVVTKKVFLLP